MATKKPRSYEENPNDQAALEQAINEVPVKDYSDYEIAIETKDHYEDALFSDEDDLTASLTGEQAVIAAVETEEKTVTPEQPDKAQQASHHDHTQKKHSPSSVAADNTTELPIANPEFSFTDLLTPASKQEQFELKDSFISGSEETELLVIESGLNHSAVNANIDYDLLLEDFSPAIEPLGTVAQDQAPVATEVPTQSGNSFKDKLLKKAQSLQDKAKHQLAEVSGKNLPNRELPLEFMLSATKTKKDSDDLTSQYDINKLFNNKGKSIYSIMKQADEDLNRLAKAKMLYVNRLKLLNAYTEKLSDKIRDAIVLYQRKPSLPKEAGKRLELIHHSQNALKALISGYKQVYAELYEANNVIYAAQHKTANDTAFRLLDILLLEQQLNLTLHFAKPLGSAKVVNKIFHALAHYETGFADQACSSLTLDRDCSARELFIRYHLYSALDLHTLSSKQHPMLHRYIDSIINTLEVLPLDHPPVEQRCWYIYHDSPALPQLNQQANQPSNFKPLRITVDRALNQIAKDYEEWLEMLGNQTMQHSATAFEGVKPTDAICVMTCLNRAVQNIEHHYTPPSFSLYEPIKAKAYSTLEDCCNYMDYVYHRAQPNTPKADDSDEQREPIKKPQVSTAPWHCALKDDEHLYLQTNEAKVGIMLDIGLPLLFLEESDEADQPWLALITRVERLPGGKINLLAEKVTSQLSTMLVHHSDDKPLPALLGRYNEQSLLIISPQCPLHTDARFTIDFPDGHSAIIAIDQLHSLSPTTQLASLK